MSSDLKHIQQAEKTRDKDKNYRDCQKHGDHKAFQDRVNKFRVSNGLKAQEVKR